MNERLDTIDNSTPHRLEAGGSTHGSAEVAGPVTGKSRRFSKMKIALLSSLAVLAVFFVGVGLVLWVLLNHSVSNEQVRAQIETQLNTFLGASHSAVIGDTKVALGDGGLLSIDASNVKILRDNSINLGVAREVGVKIKSIPLIGGNVVAESITMRGASVALTSIIPSKVDAELRPIWPRFVDFEAALQSIGGMIAEIAKHVEDAGLESIALEDTKLVGFDQLGLRSREALVDSLEVRAVNGEGTHIDLDFAALLKTDFSDWNLKGRWFQEPTGIRTLQFTAVGLKMSDLIGPAVSQELASDMDHPVTLKFSAGYRVDGTPLPAQTELTIGPGTIPVGKGLKAELKQANINLRLNPDSNQLEFERSTLSFEGAGAVFSGGIRYPKNAKDTISLQPVFRIFVEEFDAFGLVESATPPKGQLSLEGFIDPLHQRVEADRIVLTTPSGELSGNATLLFDQSQPHIKMDLSVADMPIDEFKQFWPAVLAPKARSWMDKNLSGGQMKNAWMKADFPPGLFGKDELYQPANLSVQIPIKSTNMNNPGELPTIANASGVLNVTGNKSNVVVTGGTANLPGVGKLRLAKSTMVMGNYAIPITPAELKLNFAGPAAAMVRLASLEPLGFESRLNIDPKQISGQAKANVNAHFLIGQSMSLAKKPWKTRLQATGVSSKKPIEGRRLKNANLKIVATPKEAKVTGSAEMDGVPIQLSLLENLDGSKKSESKVELTLDDKARKKMGLDTGSVLKGPVTATITSLSDGSQKVEANLKAARLDFPWVGWSKGQGIAANATFIMKQTDKNTTFRDIKLRGDGFTANGSFVVDKSGLREANVTNVVLNRVDDFDVRAKRNGKQFNISLNARVYDGRALIRSLINADIKPSENKTTNIAVKGKIGRLIGFGGQELTNVQLVYLQNGSKISRVQVEALAPNNAPTRFSLGSVPGGTKTEIFTDNGGSVLRFLDLYTKARGGRIAVNLIQDDSKVFRGKIDASNFTLLNEPRLAQLLKKPEPSAELVNGEQVVQQLRKIKTDKAKVDHLEARIAKGPGFLTITKGRLTGGDASAAFDGNVYDTSNRIKIKGTYLPGRALNRFVSKIPILGLAFGRGQVNGLLGITFRLGGRYDNPKLRVNPLSIIAPGVFRQIFKF